MVSKSATSIYGNVPDVTSPCDLFHNVPKCAYSVSKAYEEFATFDEHEDPKPNPQCGVVPYAVLFYKLLY